jgi:hypothetical protein
MMLPRLASNATKGRYALLPTSTRLPNKFTGLPDFCSPVYYQRDYVTPLQTIGPFGQQQGASQPVQTPA